MRDEVVLYSLWQRKNGRLQNETEEICLSSGSNTQHVFAAVGMLKDRNASQRCTVQGC